MLAVHSYFPLPLAVSAKNDVDRRHQVQRAKSAKQEAIARHVGFVPQRRMRAVFGDSQPAMTC